MTMDDYQNAWRGQNMPSGDPGGLAMRMRSEEKRRRVLMTFMSVNTALAFGVTGYVLLFRRPLNMAEVFPAFAAQSALAVGLAVLVRKHRARRKVLEATAMSVVEAARSCLRATESEMRDSRLLAGVAGVAVLLLGLAVYQLRLSGKMDERAVAGFAGMLATVLIANGAARWWKHTRTLAPRRAGLLTILRDLGDEAR
jgi:hypothetical protein